MLAVWEQLTNLKDKAYQVGEDSSAHTDLTHLYTQRVFGDSSVHTHTYLWGGWVGGVGIVSYLGLAHIPNCNCTHTHIPLGWGGWVGGVGMVTYLGLAYIPNYHVLNTNYHVLQNQLL